MLIRIKSYIVVVVLDSFRIRNFHYLTVAWAKISLLLELIWAHLCILIIRRKIDILILGIGPTQGLDDTTLTVEAQYSFNFSRLNKKFCLSLHYNAANSFSFVTATKIYQLQAKGSEIKKHSLCLGNISEDFSDNSIKKQD